MSASMASSKARPSGPLPAYASPAPSISLSPADDDDDSSAYELFPYPEAPPSPDTAHSILDQPPPYSDSAVFAPSVHLQLETQGKRLFSLPIPPRAVPISIFDVEPDSGIYTATRFVSIRPSRGSGSCFLVAGSDSSDSDNSTAGSSSSSRTAALSTTTYRFGPGRPPRVVLFTPSAAAAAAVARPQPTDTNITNGEPDEDLAWDAFELHGVGLFTRAQTFKTRLGTFEWRYAGKAERRAAGADSLLVLDRVVTVARARNGSGGGSGCQGDDELVRTPVAHLVRNAAVRSAGTSSATAGNGGRLLVDVRLWREDGQDVKADTRGESDADMAVVMAVTTAILMLKKEVDRRRAQQFAMMAAMSGGGS